MLEVFKDLFAAFKPVHALVRPCKVVHHSVFINDLYSFQLVDITDLKVIGVMGRRDF